MNKNRKTIKMPVRYLMNAVLVALLFVGLSFLTQNVLSTYQNKVLMTVGINIILAVSLNVATGYLGQLPLGHAGFMAVGAYTCALFTKFCPLPDGVSFAIGLVLACIVAGLFGVLIGIPALRLTGDYLAILTLGFGEIIRITLNNIDDVLGFKLFYGSKGLKNIPKYSNFTNVFLCVVITCFLIHAMMKSRHGRAVLAIRDNEIAAESCGIQTTYYKVMAFAFSAAFAGLAGGLYACYIGVPALRLTGDYLAILTLGFGEIIRITLNNIDDVLGFKLFYGSKGLKNIPKYSNFTNVFLCVVITCFLIHAMMKSRHGRAVLAIRDNEIAAESCGIQTTYYKVMAFAFSAAFAGMAGGLYACYIGVLNPSTFGFMKSIEILVMVVLGGMGSMLGSILSATVLTILPEATRSFESYRMVVYSLVLILMMIFRPGGLLGSYDFSLSRIVEKAMNGELFRKHTKKEAADHE